MVGGVEEDRGVGWQIDCEVLIADMLVYRVQGNSQSVGVSVKSNEQPAFRAAVELPSDLLQRSRVHEEC